MLYGSSPLFNINSYGLTGPTGPVGPVGPIGPVGPTGSCGATGPTGQSINGMTLSNDGIVLTRFDDNLILSAQNQIRGATGNYYLNANADVLSLGFNIIHGVSQYEVDDNGVERNIIRLKGFTTNSEDIIRINKNNENNNNIDIEYTLFNVAFIGISGGSVGQILHNKPGDKQYGLTGSFYTESQKTVDAQISNYSERIIFVDAIEQSVGTDAATVFYYWNIDWENGNIHKLNPYDSSGKDVLSQIINIRTPSNELVSRGLTIIIPSGITSSTEFSTIYATTDDLTQTPDIDNLEYGISWPISLPPCITQNIDILNLISVGEIWNADFSHLGITYDIALNVVGDRTKIPSIIDVENINFNCAGGVTFGVCCPSDCGITAYETIEVLCNGIFYPGLTVGTCDDICGELGICCIKNNTDVISVPDLITSCQCASLAETNNSIEYIWTPLSACILGVSDIDCTNAFNGVGPCCDGNGICTENISYENCIAQLGYYQGNGLKCTNSLEVPRCSGGTGGCCEPNIFPQESPCIDNVNGAECINSGKHYLGCSIPCSSYDCGIFATCFNSIPDIPVLEEGAEFDGGIVVGIFKPNGTKCLGNTAFGGPDPFALNSATIWNDEDVFNLLTNGDERLAGEYFSKFGFGGYGFSRTANHNCEEDSWLLIVSKYPVMLNEDVFNPINTDIQDLQSLKSFTWSHGGTYFGNIMTDSGAIPQNTESFPNDGVFPGDVTPDEGWYAFATPSGITYYGNNYSFLLSCPSFYNQNPLWRSGHGPFRARATMNGRWNTNWGLYNTIRMVCAERHAYDLDVGYDAIFGERYYFGEGFTTGYTLWIDSQQSSSEAISAYNLHVPSTQGSPRISDWYIPSMDELSFIADKVVNANLNGVILTAGGVAIGDDRLNSNNWIWSSTGSFNEGNTGEYWQTEFVQSAPNEGDSVAPVSHGTEAWALKITDTNNVYVQKANRVSNKFEVRPVKMIRCDGSYYDTNSNPAKYWRFWKIPNLPIDKIINGPT